MIQITFWVLAVAFLGLIIYFVWEQWAKEWFYNEPLYPPYNELPDDTEVILPEKQSYITRIEAVMVCVDYGDFLAWTLPQNKNHFDRLVVVTSSKDNYTQEICSFYHVECLVTDSFYDGGGFNKANGINFGLNHLKKDGWVVHLDADIVLPPRTGQILRQLPLDPKGIYGIDRANIFNFIDWVKFLQRPHNQHQTNGFLESKYEAGSRLLNLDRDGWIPIGYFQMWCPSVSVVSKYPDFHRGADRTDALFPYNWKREDRHLLPEIICYHLESENAPLGANWNGRKTRRFEI
jgi:glycosyltransferase involved in cell wall biosynthesis